MPQERDQLIGGGGNRETHVYVIACLRSQEKFPNFDNFSKLISVSYLTKITEHLNTIFLW